MKNNLIGKYTIKKEDNKLIIIKNDTKNELECNTIDLNLIDYAISSIELLDEGSLKDKYALYSDCNYASSEVILDKLPYEGFDLNKEYLRIIVKDLDGNNQELFVDISNIDELNNKIND